MPTVHIEPTHDDLVATCVSRLSEFVNDRNGAPTSIVLTGGTIAHDIHAALPADQDWSHVDWYWGDERFVPAGHDDRNDFQARRDFLDRFGVSESRIHAMPAHSCEESMAEAADRHAAELPDEDFDLVILGLGPDAHVASLFPRHASLSVTDRQVIEEFDSPKPPPQRLSMTFPRLNRATIVWFWVSGDGKAEAVAQALADEGSTHVTPARGVTGRGDVTWFLDQAAASRL